MAKEREKEATPHKKRSRQAALKRHPSPATPKRLPRSLGPEAHFRMSELAGWRLATPYRGGRRRKSSASGGERSRMMDATSDGMPPTRLPENWRDCSSISTESLMSEVTGS